MTPKQSQQAVLGELAPPQLNHWSSKHPQEWSKKDVLDWIYWVVEKYQLDGSKFHGEAYREFDGCRLCKMDKKQFQNVDPYFGTKIYETLRSLLNRIFFQKFNHCVNTAFLDSVMNSRNVDYTAVDRNNKNIEIPVTYCGAVSQGMDTTESKGQVYLGNDLNDNEISIEIPSLGVYPISRDIELPIPSSFAVPINSSTPAFLSTPLPTPCVVSSLPRLSPITAEYAYDQGYSSEDSFTFMPPLHPSPPSNAFVNDERDLGINGSKKINPSLYLRNDNIKKEVKKCRNGSVKSGHHLWEFVLELLRNPATNPRLLKWEDKDFGVFRFVQSQKVAQLWGEKKKNPQMNYEKLSRAMSQTIAPGLLTTS